MEAQLVHELVGYLASILVAVSLMMSKIVRLRIVNLLGAVTFAGYGVLIGSIPVAAVNAFIVLVNVWYLWGILRSDEFFRILPVRPDNEYLGAFLDFHEAEILRHQPHFEADSLKALPDRQPGPDRQRELTCLFVLRDLVPAGLLVGRTRPGGTLAIELDFVIPSYRDFKVGRYLFREQARHFIESGIRRVSSRPGRPAHRAYLLRMGFQPEAGDAPDADRLVLELEPPSTLTPPADS